MDAEVRATQEAVAGRVRERRFNPKAIVP